MPLEYEDWDQLFKQNQALTAEFSDLAEVYREGAGTINNAVKRANNWVNSDGLKALQAVKNGLARNYYDFIVDSTATPSANVFNSLRDAVQALPDYATGRIRLAEDILLDGNIGMRNFRGVIQDYDGNAPIIESTPTSAGMESGYQASYLTAFKGIISKCTIKTCEQSDDVSVYRSFFREANDHNVYLGSSKIEIGRQPFLSSYSHPVSLITNRYGSGVDIKVDNSADESFLLKLYSYAPATLFLANISLPDGIKAESLVVGAKLVNGQPSNILTNLTNWA